MCTKSQAGILWNCISRVYSVKTSNLRHWRQSFIGLASPIMFCTSYNTANISKTRGVGRGDAGTRGRGDAGTRGQRRDVRHCHWDVDPFSGMQHCALLARATSIWISTKKLTSPLGQVLHITNLSHRPRRQSRGHTHNSITTRTGAASHKAAPLLLDPMRMPQSQGKHHKQAI